MSSGGAREGAGRKPTRSTQKPVIIRILPRYIKRLDKLAKSNGVGRGEMIEKLIDSIN